VSGPPKLLDRVREAIRTRHYSRRTEEAYVYWIRRYIVFHRKAHPSTMGAADISAFLTWLAVRQHVSASTQNQALSALLFLYRHVLGIEVGPLEQQVPRARTPERLPVVLSREEVTAVLKHLTGTMKLVAVLLYGAGLRLRECLELRVKDIDFDRREIVVRQGKGQKDRVTMLSTAAKVPLSTHLDLVRRQHHDDLAHGFGRVVLPFAIGRKVRQRGHGLAVAVCVSSGADLPRSAVRSTLSISRSQIRGTARGRGRGSARRGHEAGELPHLSACVCHAPARGWLRHPDRAGAARAS
jgi:integron integrase